MVYRRAYPFKCTPDTFIAYGKNVFAAAMTRLVFTVPVIPEAIAPGGLSDLAGAESSNKGTQNYNTYGRVVTSLPGREWGWDDEPP